MRKPLRRKGFPMQIQGAPQAQSAVRIEAGGRSGVYRQGETLGGEVVSVEDGVASIRLASGEQLRAQIAPGVTMQQGQQVRLTVLGAEGEQIVMKLEADVAPQLSGVTGGDARAAQIFNLMRQYGLSASKENFARVDTLLSSFPNMDERTAVFLAANVKTLPEGGAHVSLRQLAQALMAPGTDGVAQPLDALIAALSSEVGDPPLARALLAAFRPLADEARAAPMQGGLKDVLSEADRPHEGAQALSRFLTQAAPEGYRALAASGSLGDAAAMLRAAASLPAEQAARLLSAFAAAQPAEPPDLLPALTRALDALVQPGLSPSTAPQAEVPAQTEAFLAQILPQMPSEGRPPQSAPEAAGIAQQPTQQNEQPVQQPPSAQAQGPQGTQEARQSASLAPQMPQAAQPAVPAASQPPVQPAAPQAAQAAPQPPVSAPQLAALADSLFVRLPGEGDAGGELRRVAETLLEGLGRLREGMAALPAREAAAAVAYQADARAQALPQIQQFHYMQLPVQLYDRRQSAELYVMRRPGRVKAEGEETTVLIALETENMGRVEAILKAMERSVSLTFRMKSGEAAEAVRNALPDLGGAVEQAGYKLREAIIAAQDEPVTPQTFMSLLSQLERGARQKLNVMA